jgi:predicted Zn-dependent protease with MMP-like domain
MDEFESVVASVVDSLPDSVRAQLDNVTIEVAVRPTPDQDPHGDRLFGLYEGIPLPERGFDYFGVAPDRIYIFATPHLALGLDDDELRAEIRRTVLHEIGHHIGLSDDRLTEIGWD